MEKNEQSFQDGTHIFQGFHFGGLAVSKTFETTRIPWGCPTSHTDSGSMDQINHQQQRQKTYSDPSLAGSWTKWII